MGEISLTQATALAAAQTTAIAALADVYAELAAEVERRRPRCDASGRCCHFESFGHRLYVTTLELAAFLREQPTKAQRERTRLPLAEDSDACPFQVDRLCGVHAIRPFGCRIFYCDPTAQQWQQDLYEKLHAQIKMLHRRFDIPYFYVEWRSALAELLPAVPVLRNDQVSAP